MAQLSNAALQAEGKPPVVIDDSNSTLLRGDTRLIFFDPFGAPPVPPATVIRRVEELNNEFAIGQRLCLDGTTMLVDIMNEQVSAVPYSRSRSPPPPCCGAAN